LCECRRVLEASEDVLRLLLSFQNLERSLLLDEEAWCLVVRDPLQLQKQERSNDREEEKEDEEDGHTEEPRAAFMSLPLLASSSSSFFLFPLLWQSRNRQFFNSSPSK
jgi:hypothetical protein